MDSKPFARVGSPTKQLTSAVSVSHEQRTMISQKIRTRLLDQLVLHGVVH
jgi:hypothetical protein